MFKHLLVPLDGSHLAEAALTAALTLSARFESVVTLVRVVQPPSFFMTAADGAAYAAVLDDLRQQAGEEAKTYLKSHQGSLRQQGYSVRIQMIEGESVAEAILDAAAASGADTIVMSTHGRGGLSRWVNGSVADRILRRSAVPVLLIRAQAEAVAAS